jgi:phosphoenolpyruvate synthase/pyruvate phosphate dikinase
MLGHRGCRLGITYPEITRMQARAIIEAACHLAKNEHMTIRTRNHGAFGRNRQRADHAKSSSSMKLLKR